MNLSDEIRAPAECIGGPVRSKPKAWFIEMSKKVAVLENLLLRAHDFMADPEYDDEDELLGEIKDVLNKDR